MPDTDAIEGEPEAAVPLLSQPRDGVPEPLTGNDELSALIDTLARGTGPVAFDAERASGYRYSQRAYLIQLRREGAGTALIDPIALPALSGVNSVLQDCEWLLHAASQDLQCMAEVGLHPPRLFDTELAGRLLGEERVALGTMVEQHLGVRLEKGHSAADWSTRPLPHDWLVYAALDVELLADLRDVLAVALNEAGKDEWARQEFEAARLAPAPVPRQDPWRRTSGIHALRNRRQLGVARALWTARDSYAARRDVAPGRVLPDSAIIEAAKALPRTQAALLGIGMYNGPRQRRQVERWFAAIAEAMDQPEDELPPMTGNGGDGMPPPSRWRERDPAAAARLEKARAAVAAIAEQHQVLGQNLLASDVVRRLCWEPPEVTADAVRVRMAELGARAWQIELTLTSLTEALAAAAPE